MSFPAARPRRLRRTPALRRLVADVRVAPSDLVLPVFVKEGITDPAPIASMPGVVQHTRDSLKKAVSVQIQIGSVNVTLGRISAR